jgi:hypothetical protein
MRQAEAGNARRSVLYALIAPALWLGSIATYALAAPNLPAGFRAHLIFGLVMFGVLVLGPLLLVLLTLNWIVRRVAALIVTVLVFGTARGGLSQGFGLGADVTIVSICLILIGSVLFFLSRPPVQCAVDDFYNFLSLRDLLSIYTFRRKRRSTP